MIANCHLTSRRRALACAKALALALALSACESAPVTGRNQIIAIDEQSEIDLGAEAYRQTLEKSTLSSDKATNDMVRRVGWRIAGASGRSDYKWEFKVVQDDKTVNAFALPGGKVVVYTGMLKVTQDEAGLATVLGHEIGHATARHGAERMTHSEAIHLILKGGDTAALSNGLQNRDPDSVKAVTSAFAVGPSAGEEQPYDEKQEKEADRIGLIYMAQAGYDPAQAIEFWKRMSQLSDARGLPPFLQTHPSHESRVQNLAEWLPEAQAEYKKSPQKPR
jgi:predicted Zn-dependent protease